MWMTDMLSQWLAVPASLSTWPEMLGSDAVSGMELCGVCVLQGRLSEKLEVPWAGLPTGLGLAGTPRSPKGPRGSPGGRLPQRRVL